jgi:hypothetical protein
LVDNLLLVQLLLLAHLILQTVDALLRLQSLATNTG